MWKDDKFQPSETRTYVAICYNTDYDGHFFRKFVLPFHGETKGDVDDNGLWLEGSHTVVYHNTCAQASWYFTNVLNTRASIECCIPFEQYVDLKDQDKMNRQNRIEMERAFPKKTVILMPRSNQAKIKNR